MKYMADIREGLISRTEIYGLTTDIYFLKVYHGNDDCSTSSNHVNHIKSIEALVSKYGYLHKFYCTWMDDAGVTLVDGVAAAGHSVAHRSPLEGAFTADHVILTTAPAHNVPLWARTVVIQIPVI